MKNDFTATHFFKLFKCIFMRSRFANLFVVECGDLIGTDNERFTRE